MADKQRVPPERTRGEGEQKKRAVQNEEESLMWVAVPDQAPPLLNIPLKKIYACSLSIPLLLSRSLQRGADSGWRGMGQERQRQSGRLF